MKHIALLTTLLLSAAGLSAAGNVPTLQLDSVVADVPYPKTKEVFSVDETGRQWVKCTYQWNSATRDWVGYEMLEQTVNDKGLVVDETYSQWSYEGGNWVKAARITYAYTMLGYYSQRVEYSWNGQTWQNSSKNEVVYNERGQMTQQFYHLWNKQTADWAFFIKMEWTYNKNDQLTSNNRYILFSNSTQWEPLAEETTRYDEQGRELESTSLYKSINADWWQTKSVSTTTYSDTLNFNTTTAYSWDNSTSQWQPFRKTEEQFDTNGLSTASSLYSWDYTPGNEQNPFLQEQEHYSYNQSGSITSHEHYEDYNFDGILDCIKQENEYNENNQKIRTLESYQDGYEGKWHMEFDTKFAYDTFGNELSEIRYDLYYADSVWVGNRKVVKTYDYTHQVNALCAFSNEVETTVGGQLPTSSSVYYWDWNNNDWYSVPEHTTQYHYSPYTAPTPPETDNKLQVFLDPLGNILYVDDKEVGLLGTSPEKPVRVYDVSGGLQILTSARIINVSELPNGLYFVIVNGQTRRVMKR